MTEGGAVGDVDDERGTPWWSGSTAAAALTAVSTVLVALSAFLSAQAASNSDDNYAVATLALTDANFFYEQAADALLEELAAEGVEVDRICMLALITDAAAGQCDGVAELEDFAADDPILAAGDDAQEVADAAFAVGLEESNRSVAYQAALVMYAVALALSAWASLSETSSRSRVIFLVLALVSLAAGTIRLATV